MRLSGRQYRFRGLATPRDGVEMDKEGPGLNTVIRTFANEAEAHVAQAVLDANGIDSFLIRDDANGMMPWLQWLHPIRLVVREEDSGDAANLLDTPPGPTLAK
jgi:Putative prokaryotic signal transducing protein